MKATDIRWDTDGAPVDLPSEVDIPEDVIEEAGRNGEALLDLVSDYLSDLTGLCHDGFFLEED